MAGARHSFSKGSYAQHSSQICNFHLKELPFGLDILQLVYYFDRRYSRGCWDSILDG
jgi:hypothetical protein